MTLFDKELDTLINRLENPRTIKTPQALELEARGPETWLRTLFPRSFKYDFSESGLEFWRVAWRILLKRWNNIPLTVEEYSIMLFLARGLGKSTHGEALCIAEGGVVGEGYDLYLSDTDDMAEEHLFNIAELINQGQVEQFYPQLARPKINDLTGEQAEFSKKALITEGNWSVTAKGLRGNVRGSRKAALRFTMVLGDDIDRLDESIVVVDKKKRNLSRSVLGAGTTKMQFFFLQNIIHEGSIANQIHTHQTDLFSERIVICDGPVKAFDELTIKTYVGDDGQIKHEITHFKAHWKHFDIAAARKFLAQSGKEAFLAEYQHEFDLKKDKVIPNFNRKAQAISWSMFEAMFGYRYIPEHWTRRAAADIGYTEKSNSAWSWVATSPKNTKLPNKKFMYRGFTFVNKSIGDQMLRFWAAMFPDKRTGRDYFECEINFGLYPDLFRKLITLDRCREHLEKFTYNHEFNLWEHPDYGLQPFFHTTCDAFQLSHEKSGEVLTIHENYGLPVQKIKQFGDSDGVSQWNELCAQDHTVPNAFHPDTLVTDEGTNIEQYEIGDPDLYYILDDKEYREGSRSDAGLKKQLENVAKWRYVRQNITESGIAEAKPMKMEGGDTVDSERAVYVTFGSAGLELTAAEQFDRFIATNHEHLTARAIQQLQPDQRGFAEVERSEKRDAWDKDNSSVFVPDGLEELDF